MSNWMVNGLWDVYFSFFYSVLFVFGAEDPELEPPSGPCSSWSSPCLVLDLLVKNFPLQQLVSQLLVIDWLEVIASGALRADMTGDVAVIASSSIPSVPSPFFFIPIDVGTSNSTNSRSYNIIEYLWKREWKYWKGIRLEKKTYLSDVSEIEYVKG